MFDIELDMKPDSPNTFDISFASSDEKSKESNKQQLTSLISSKVNTLKFNKNNQKKHKRESSVPIILMNRTVKKMERSYRQFHCPQGLGYYLIEDTNCTKYKYCQDWNSEFASLSINKCHQGVFSFHERKCVSYDEYTCDETTPKFVPEL